MPRCLEVYRSVPRVLAARALSELRTRPSVAALAPLRLVHHQTPSAPAPGWARVKPRLSGICGSDLSMLSGGSSFYFSALVSMPFVPGHEVLGELAEDLDDLRRGERVVLDPLLPCGVRGVEPACAPCRQGETGSCERVTAGHLGAGLQTGYCHDTGGGWSETLLAHRRQLHPVPERLSDRAAVLVEPMACAIRAVRRAGVPDGAVVLVVGAGTIGLLTVIALRALARPGRLIVVARYGHQASFARRYGAEAVSPEECLGMVRRTTGAFRLDPQWSPPFLLGGADVAFDCGGSASSLEIALRATRAGGVVVLSAMPAAADLAPAWFRELRLTGSYSGAGSFDDAISLLSEETPEELVGDPYPLTRWRDALEDALNAGRHGAFKVVFDPRGDDA